MSHGTKASKKPEQLCIVSGGQISNVSPGAAVKEWSAFSTTMAEVGGTMAVHCGPASAWHPPLIRVMTARPAAPDSSTGLSSGCTRPPGTSSAGGQSSTCKTNPKRTFESWNLKTVRNKTSS